MALHAIAAALPALLPAEGEYTPATMTTDLVAGVATVLPWVGAGVGGGIALYFVFLGIRKGFAFFRSLAK